MTWGDTVYLLPEIVIAIGASLLLLAPVSGFRSTGSAPKWAMLGVLAATAIAVVFCSQAVAQIDQTPLFAEMFALDAFSIFFKLLFIVTIAGVTLLSDDFLRGTRYSPWEYYSLL
ncbi:MAG TPA: hypothetical protein VHL59_15925 [Thermoanaerobaculia bacterium]|nr:hypothetical protein [Thermoanaerobaculia bacterium]